MKKNIFLIILIIPYLLIPKAVVDPKHCVEFLVATFQRRAVQKFCSSTTNLKELVIGLIYAETHSIYASIYMLTDKDIFEALVCARKRGVHIEIITEGSTAYGSLSKIPQLQRLQIPIYISPNKRGSIMHMKDMLFGKNIYGVPIILTGSANLTGGMVSNIETINLLVDSNLYAQSRQEFEGLKRDIIESWK